MSEPKTTPRCLLDAINDENCEAGTVEQLRREHAVCRLGVEDPILAQSAGLHLELFTGQDYRVYWHIITKSVAPLTEADLLDMARILDVKFEGPAGRTRVELFLKEGPVT